MEGLLVLNKQWSIPVSNIKAMYKENNRIKIDLIYPAINDDTTLNYFTLQSLDDSANDLFFDDLVRRSQTSDVTEIYMNDDDNSYDYDGCSMLEGYKYIFISNIGVLYNHGIYVVIFFKHVMNGMTNIKLDCKTIANRDLVHNHLIKAIHSKNY